MLQYIRTIKKTCLCLGFLLLGSHGMAQNIDSLRHHPYAPVGIPHGAPQWMTRLTDVENVNYYEMVDSFEQFKHDHPEMRVKTPMTKAVINYFKRWQKAYRPYVTKDGKIAVPASSDFRKFVEDMNTRGKERPLNAVATASKWEVISPLMTYHMTKKIAYPGQANVQRFDIFKNNPDLLYCGTETGMVFKTTNKGMNWKPCAPDFYFGGEIKTLEISYSNPDKVLVGAGYFLWLTTDGGNTWKNITPPELRNSNSLVRDAVFHPEDDNRILLGNGKGLYQSTDGGQNWTQVQQGMCFDIKHKHNAPNVVYALIREDGGVKLKVSQDGGRYFQRRSFQTAYELASGRIGLSSAPGGSEYIYVLGCKFDGGREAYEPFYIGPTVLLKSTDGGMNWISRENITEQMPAYEVSRNQGYYNMMISASSKDPEQVFFGMLDFYRSDDGGKTLSHKGGYSGQFELHCDMQDIHILGNDTWISSDGGLIYSSDFFTAHADARIQGIYASEFLGFDQGWNEDVIVGGRHHNGDMAQMDKYNGAAIHMGGGEEATGYVLLSDPHKVAFSDTNPKNVVLPDDWKDPFVPFLDFWTYPSETSYGVGLEFDPRYAKSFLLFRGYGEEKHILWKTVDDGQSFVQLYKFSTPINSHVISRSNPEKIVVSTMDNLYQSLDGGNTFKPFETIPDGVRNSMQLLTAIHPRNENEIWITAFDNPGCIYRTTDNGKSWELLDKGLTLPMSSPLFESKEEKVAISRFFLTGNDKDAAYAIGYVMRSLGKPNFIIPRGRVFYRDNTTDGWQDYSEGFPPVITLARMLPFYKKGKIRIATNNGIWERDLVDPHFKPIAQPLILNVGKPDNTGNMELHFDSYSIVNQENATWEWKFNPQPLYVSDPTARNPVVRIAAEQSYDVTLTVKTPEGSDTKTVKKMIAGKKDVPTSIAGLEVLKHDVLLSASVCPKGTPVTLQPQGITEACQWQLFNAAGKQVDTRTVAPTGTTSVATQALTPGIYFYLLTNKTFKKTGKIIIQ